MTTSLSDLDFGGWLDRWDRQQSAYIPLREERFAFMLEVVRRVCGESPRVLDLMCGPGAISRRVLRELPGATVVAVDLDPVLVEIGRRVLGDGGGRLQWIEADLNDPSWPAALPFDSFDAVLSTTAIHWLRAGEIVNLYRTLATLIRPGGVLLNGDQMKFRDTHPVLRQTALSHRDDFRAAATASGAESWEDWWAALRTEAALEPLLAERDRRFAWRHAKNEAMVGSRSRSHSSVEVVHTGYELHLAALLDAGFSEAGTAWQHFDNRVLAAVR